jgi:hypothetical protein
MPQDAILALVLLTERAKLWTVIPMMTEFVMQMKLAVARTSMRQIMMHKLPRTMVLVCQAITVA